jgi:hypothetical protein
MSFDNNFKQLRSQTIKRLTPYSWWVQAALVPVGSNEALAMLFEIDEVCVYLEKNNLEELSNKIKPFFSLEKKILSHY